jgi:Recombinase
MRKGCRSPGTIASRVLPSRRNLVVAAKDPDRRVGEAIALVFAKFAKIQSVRQVHLWFRHERVPLPAVTYGAEDRLIEWKLPVYNTILHILTNPIYAGAYAFGRTGSRISIEAGRKKVVRGFKKGAQGLGGADPEPS